MTSLPGHLWSREVTLRDFLYVTVTSCELQPCRSYKLYKARAFGLSQPLPGDFR